MPHYDYGTEFSEEGFGSISSYTPEFVAEAPQPVVVADPVTSANSDDQWEEILRSSPPELEQQPTEVEPSANQPAVEPTSLQAMPVTEHALFPKTAHPDELDFSQLQSTQPHQSVSDASHAVEEVAGRGNTAINR